MMPALRVKFALLLIAAMSLAALAWSGASGQFRPPGSSFNRPRPFNRGVRPRDPMNPLGIRWQCPQCGRTGDGAIPPRTCPGCGITFINGMDNPPATKPPDFNPPPNEPVEGPKSSSRKTLTIVLVVGTFVVGASVLLGGALLVIYNIRNSNSSSRRRGRSRRDDYYD